MTAQGQSFTATDTSSRAVQTTTLSEGTASTQSQAVVLESVPDTEVDRGLVTSSAKIVKTKATAKSQATSASLHMGVNIKNTFFSTHILATYIRLR